MCRSSVRDAVPHSHLWFNPRILKVCLDHHYSVRRGKGGRTTVSSGSLFRLKVVEGYHFFRGLSHSRLWYTPFHCSTGSGRVSPTFRITLQTWRLWRSWLLLGKAEGDRTTHPLNLKRVDCLCSMVEGRGWSPHSVLQTTLSFEFIIGFTVLYYGFHRFFVSS